MKKVRLFSITVHFFVVFAALVIWSCSENESVDGYGRVKVSLTDAPFSVNLIEEANITITKIEIRHKDSVSGNPFVVVFEDSAQANLVDLRNGIVEELASVEVPSGDYDLVRVYVGDASIKLVNGIEYDLKVPSGAQTGIKVFVNPNIQVEGGLTTELLLDFELNKSFVAKGNTDPLEDIKGFNFKPVIRAVNNSVAGRIEGYVVDSTEAGIAAAQVWIEKDTVVSSTTTDSTGFYALIGIPEGSYTLFSVKEDLDTLVVEDVNVATANKTEIDLQLTNSQE